MKATSWWKERTAGVKSPPSFKPKAHKRSVKSVCLCVCVEAPESSSHQPHGSCDWLRAESVWLESPVRRGHDGLAGKHMNMDAAKVTFTF